MIFVPGGAFEMGSDRFYPEERPMHIAEVADFFIAEHAVTNAEFAEFVLATGYVTVAERELDEADFPALSADERRAGSLAFHETSGPVDLRDWRQWWTWVPGANWRQPFGPGSSLDGKELHPVVQVSFADALAFATWSDARLPSETEWERAARGGTSHQEFAWGSELHPNGAVLANTWQGRFPYENLGALGHKGTAPVASFPANGYGLYDMIGNVWEWTSSVATPDHRAASMVPKAGGLDLAPSGGGCGCGCGPSASIAASGAAAGTDAGAGADAGAPANRITKGGSHLCSPDYCQRYRPAARSPQSEDSATTHLGFRIARTA